MLIPQSRLDEGGVKAGERTLVWFTAGNDEPTDDWTRMTSFIPENTQARKMSSQELRIRFKKRKKKQKKRKMKKH